MAAFGDLPAEMLGKIFSYLSVKEKIECCTTSQEWYREMAPGIKELVMT